jgi:hypothetical protein
MRNTMRVLLLLTAFLAALGGVMTGTAATAQPVESRASVSSDVQESPVAHAHIAPSASPLTAFRQAATWHPVRINVALSARPLFGDRLRE